MIYGIYIYYKHVSCRVHRPVNDKKYPTSWVAVVPDVLICVDMPLF